MPIQQDLSGGNYGAVVVVPATAVAAPKRDATSGQLTALSPSVNLVDQTGAALGTNANPLVTSGGGGGGGSNASVGLNNAAAPTSSTQFGFISGGNLVPASSANPIPVTVLSGGGSNASVGATGAAAPASATEIGFIDGLGNLVAPSAAAGMPVAQQGAWTVGATQSGAWTVAATQSGAWNVGQSGTWNVGVTGTVAVTQSGTWSNTVTQATAANLNAQVVGDGAAAATDTGSNPVKIAAVFNTTLPTYTNGQRSQLQTDNKGGLYVALESGGVPFAGMSTNNDSVAVATVNTSLAVVSTTKIFNGTTFDRWKKPNIVARLPSAAATTNATFVRTGPADLSTVFGYNTTASAVYLKIYNSTTNPPVPGTTPVFLTIPLPPNSAFAIDWSNGLYLNTGFGYAITANPADADTTAITAGAVVGLNLCYA